MRDACFLEESQRVLVAGEEEHLRLLGKPRNDPERPLVAPPVQVDQGIIQDDREGEAVHGLLNRGQARAEHQGIARPRLSAPHLARSAVLLAQHADRAIARDDPASA